MPPPHLRDFSVKERQQLYVYLHLIAQAPLRAESGWRKILVQWFSINGNATGGGSSRSFDLNDQSI